MYNLNLNHEKTPEKSKLKNNLHNNSPTPFKNVKAQKHKGWEIVSDKD